MTVRLSPSLGTRRSNCASPEAPMMTAGSVAAKLQIGGHDLPTGFQSGLRNVGIRNNIATSEKSRGNRKTHAKLSVIGHTQLKRYVAAALTLGNPKTDPALQQVVFSPGGRSGRGRFGSRRSRAGERVTGGHGMLSSDRKSNRANHPGQEREKVLLRWVRTIFGRTGASVPARAYSARLPGWCHPDPSHRRIASTRALISYARTIR